MPHAIDTTVHAFLTDGMTPHQEKLNGGLLGLVRQEFQARRERRLSDEQEQLKSIPRHARKSWLEDSPYAETERRSPESAALRELLDHVKTAIREDLQKLEVMADRHSAFRRAVALGVTDGERRGLILEYARDLGATKRQLKQDLRAIDRWFDEEALLDRYRRRKGELELKLAFQLSRLGQLIAATLQGGSDKTSRIGIWDRLGLEDLVIKALAQPAHNRVHVSAWQCLYVALSSLPSDQMSGLCRSDTIAMATKTAADTSLDVWLQCGALSFLRLAAPEQFHQLAGQRISTQQNSTQQCSTQGLGDDMFVRRHLVRISTPDRTNDWDKNELLQIASTDPSPFVRQQLAESLYALPDDIATQLLRTLGRDDECAQVRAAVLVAGISASGNYRQLWYLDLLQEVLTLETDTFVLRVAIHSAQAWLVRYQATATAAERNDSYIHVDAAQSREISKQYRTGILPALRRLRETAEQVPVRRWAAQSAERIWLELTPPARQLCADLSSIGHKLKIGKSCRVPKRFFDRHSPTVIGRVLAVMAQDDFGYDLSRGISAYRLTRGPVFGFRWWRFLFEFFHPATDKRQAFRHTIGRHSDGDIRSPSQILGELSQTKVPGEPLVLAQEGSWRPYVPLLDDFISILNCGWLWPKTVRFYTSEGITTVRAPRLIWRRLRAFVTLTRKFPALAASRNWTEQHKASPAEFLTSLRQLGFEIEFAHFREGDGREVAHDETVQRFFPALALIAMVSPLDVDPVVNLVRDFAAYFSSTFENSLTHLLLFSFVGLLLFLIKHWWSNATLRWARRRIPLSIGGWGTRGKSGTERVKAALFGGLGHGIVSKTTGCEAMFIQSSGCGELLEIPLFRPYDKATIWEHRDMLRMAGQLKPSVFLWECMGLTPSYVDVLQRQWTQDDLGTITNTYPDHEDLQGPAGFNVATTICRFIPRRSRLITTEQQMQPLVRINCEENETSFRSVSWLDSGLLTPDILDRFPYKEHPDNIALVLAMAQELGCEKDFALKAMADYLVPDLGVLKTYPSSTVDTRQIEFTNGMSANERFGCIGNWQRIGFDRHDPGQDPGTWICSVVNNRADRVARSRAFARILVFDLEADRHFLIGNNLKGLRGFIRESWDEYIQGVSLWEKSADRQQALANLNELAQRFRQVTTPAAIRAALRVTLDAISDDDQIKDQTLEMWDNPAGLENCLQSANIDGNLVKSIAAYQQELLQSYQEFERLAAAIRSDTGQEEKLNAGLHEMLWQWFERKLVVIENYDATGEEIIHRIVRETPPGFLNRVMGLQNIKGTGLDFVCRFQAWDACYLACEKLTDRDPRVARQGLESLTEMPVIGQLCGKKMRTAIDTARRSPTAQRDDFQTELEAIENKLNASLENTQQTLNAATTDGGSSQRGDWIIKALEELLDVNDAVRRRKTADQVYKDLCNERIARQRAIVEIRKINSQKGGWLTTALAK